ncbi:hypothetical protein GQ600_6730 [Phytophthora cactorum]|nr:hypothetical protein GQ600_6730 [Phytophthora cactorum]
MKVAEWDSMESAFAKLIYWCALDIFVPFGHCNAQTFVKSRHPDVVQEFFSLVAVLLSDSMLAKVRSEWDYFMVASALTTCNKRGSGMSEWEVKTWGYTHQCNDFTKHSPSPEYDGQSKMSQAFMNGVIMLQTVQDTMRIASEPFTHDNINETSETTQVTESTQGATQSAA